ncbi:VOC family protein [Halovenus sp. WSH3]|uniref:VOC family protein n=1 Tax=Halovenus carboxidivorans TaxID=2692199 RepID=A0A6B0TCA1_9EURY|nr:VOC family protein [Halovenus carboxidivorans]MXR52861.1 VOC family protein [Halovenus carboxidivorans]
MTDPSAHHFGVTVTDLDRSIEFYRDVLGLDVLSRFSVSGEEFATGVGVEGAAGTFAHLDAGTARVELVEYDPEGDDATGGTINQPGAKHLGLEVDDLDATCEALPDDIESLSEPQTTETGTRILFVRDPDDNLIELLEP